MGWETEIPDVVAGQPVESAWGNEVRNKLVHVVPTVGTLPADVADGGLAYVEADDLVYLRKSGVWVVAGPQGKLAYAIKTDGNLTFGPAIADMSGLTVNFTQSAARLIKVTAHCQIGSATGSSPTITGYIREGSTELGRFGRTVLTAGSEVFSGSLILVPSAGSHQYRVSLQTSVGNCDLNSSATVPAFHLIEDIGPA